MPLSFLFFGGVFLSAVRRCNPLECQAASRSPATPSTSPAGPPGLTILERTVNGQSGLAAQHDGITVTVFAVDVTAGQITRIWAYATPTSSGPG